MIHPYRRHYPHRCPLQHTSQVRCKCPIWARGVDGKGRPVRLSLKTRDWNKALNITREWEVAGNEPAPPLRQTVEDLEVAFLDDAEKGRHLDEETIRKIKTLFRQLTAFCIKKGIRYLTDLDVATVREFRNGWKDAPLSASKKLERLRGIFKFAVANKWLAENPVLMLKAPKVEDNPTLPFTEDEMQRIYKAATDKRTLAFILVMRFSGLRISDVAMLAGSSFSGDRLTLYMAKTRKPVTILMPATVVNALRSFSWKTTQHPFWTSWSKPQHAAALWRKHLGKVFRAAKVEDAHTHRLRDTFAVWFLESGGSLDDLKTLLGHTSIRTTEKHYAPWVKSRQTRLDQEVRRAMSGYDFGTISV